MHELAHEPVLITGGAGFLGTKRVLIQVGDVRDRDALDKRSEMSTEKLRDRLILARRPFVQGNLIETPLGNIQDEQPKPLACLEHAP